TGTVAGRWRLSLRAELAVFDAISRQWILGQALPRLVDFQPVAVFQDLNVLAFGSRHPIIIGAKGQVTVLVSAPTMVPIGRGQMGRQLGQVGALMLEGFSGNQPRLALGFVIHSHRGPRQRLSIDVLQTLESAAGQEIGFHRPEAPLFAGLAVAMLNLVAAEDKAILLGEGLHLRGDQRVGSGAPQPSQVGVVDNALAGGVAPEHQPFVKEALHFEPIKGAVKLEITPLAVAQVDQAGDELDTPARYLYLVEAGVV